MNFSGRYSRCSSSSSRSRLRLSKRRRRPQAEVRPRMRHRRSRTAQQHSCVVLLWSRSKTSRYRTRLSIQTCPGLFYYSVEFKNHLKCFSFPQEHIPVVTILCNPGISTRHWGQMSDIVGYDLTPDSGTTLRKVLKLNLTSYLDQFESISVAASKVRTPVVFPFKSSHFTKFMYLHYHGPQWSSFAGFMKFIKVNIL